MSFDVNIGRAQAVIKAAAGMNNDGGSGGNTGYMMSRRKKDNKKSFNPFDKDDGGDSFEMASKLPKDFEKIYEQKNDSWLDRFINKFSM